MIAETPLARWLVRKDETAEARLSSFATVVNGLDAAQRAAFLRLSQAEHLGHHGNSEQRTMMGTCLRARVHTRSSLGTEC